MRLITPLAASGRRSRLPAPQADPPALRPGPASAERVGCRGRWAGLGTSGKRVEGFGEAAGVPSHVVLDGVIADHLVRSRGGFRCAIIWRAKPARTTGTCARRLFAATAPWPRTPSPSCAGRTIKSDSPDALISVLLIF